MNVNYHKSCSTLPIYNFYKILDTSDLRFLIVGYSELNDSNVKITNDAKKLLDSIIEEYLELTNNNEVILGLRLRMLIDEQEFERNILVKILDIYNDFKISDVLLLLNEFGFNIKIDEDLDVQIIEVTQRIKGLDNKIKINNIKYNARFKKDENKNKMNLEKEALILEMNLNLGREIDVYTTSVLKWINMLQISSSKVKKLENIS